MWRRLGTVPQAARGYIATSLQAFSRARHDVRVCCTMEAPLWHSCLFTNKYGHTYFNSTLIRAGVHKVKHLFNEAGQPHHRLIKHLLPSWQTIHSTGFRIYHPLLLNDWFVPSMWAGTWAKAHSLALVAPSKRVTLRSELDTWSLFWSAPVPPSLRDFIYPSMWCKLRVRVRLFP